MKTILRKILLAKSCLYVYPYSSLNLDHDIERICESGYFSRNTILRGKRLTINDFLLWEKWNFFRGNDTSDALAFFSGTKFEDNINTYIIGTIYPSPIIVIVFYFTTLAFLLTLLYQMTTSGSAVDFQVIIPIGLLSLILLSMTVYFRWRIQKSVEHELKIIQQSGLRNPVHGKGALKQK